MTRTARGQRAELHARYTAQNLNLTPKTKDFQLSPGRPKCLNALHSINREMERLSAWKRHGLDLVFLSFMGAGLGLLWLDGNQSLQPLRWGLGLYLAVFPTGYLLLAALGRRNRWPFPERMVGSAGLGIAWTTASFLFLQGLGKGAAVEWLVALQALGAVPAYVYCKINNPPKGR